MPELVELLVWRKSPMFQCFCSILKIPGFKRPQFYLSQFMQRGQFLADYCADP